MQTILIDLPFAKDGGLANVFKIHHISLATISSSIGGFIYFCVLLTNCCCARLTQRSFEKELSELGQNQNDLSLEKILGTQGQNQNLKSSAQFAAEDLSSL